MSKQGKSYANHSASIMALLLVISDYVAVLCSEQIAVFLRNLLVSTGRGILVLSPMEMYLAIPLIYMAFLGGFQLYTRHSQFWQILRKIFYAVSLATVVVIIESFFTEQVRTTSRFVIIAVYVLSFILISLLRYLLKKLAARTRSLQTPVLIIGAGRTAELLVRAIREGNMDYRVVGFLEDNPKQCGMRNAECGMKTEKEPLTPILGGFKDAEKVIRETSIRKVFIAAPGLEQAKLAELIHRVQPLVRSVGVIPNLIDIPMGSMELESLYNEKLMVIRIKNNLASVTNRFFKWVFDFILTLLGTVCIIPLLLYIAHRIKKDSPGPIMYNGERIGQGGRLFKCLKFRSMYTNGDEILENYFKEHPEALPGWREFHKLDDDPRVTPIGKVLRRTSLDELPQIFNVLKGDMSLVGPRPYLEWEKPDMGDSYDTIVTVKPGITGLWQVSGRSDVSFEDRLRMDCWYVGNWSVWIDIMLLWKTFFVVFGKKGAK